MADLRTMVAQGRKRIGFLVGAGAAAGLPSPSGTGPLIPAVDGLTSQILATLKTEYGPTLDTILARKPKANVEVILSHVRRLAEVIGDGKIDGLDGKGYAELGRRICREIGQAVNVRLPTGENAYRNLVIPRFPEKSLFSCGAA
jgi:hypothetical protein